MGDRRARHAGTGRTKESQRTRGSIEPGGLSSPAIRTRREIYHESDIPSRTLFAIFRRSENTSCLKCSLTLSGHGEATTTDHFTTAGARIRALAPPSVEVDEALGDGPITALGRCLPQAFVRAFHQVVDGFRPLIGHETSRKRMPFRGRFAETPAQVDRADRRAVDQEDRKLVLSPAPHEVFRAKHIAP